MLNVKLPWFLKLLVLIRTWEDRMRMKRIERIRTENLVLAERTRQLCKELAGRASVETRIKVTRCVDHHYGVIERNNNSITLLKERMWHEQEAA